MVEVSRTAPAIKRSEVASYIRIPPPRSKEFWTEWKISHIRELASTGHATSELTTPQSDRTPRPLDHLYLNQTQTPAGWSHVNTQTRFTAESPLELTSPLYLGDMSFGALSGVPNIAIAKAADITGILAGTGEGGLLREVGECKRITIQWASARFGVDIQELCRGEAVVIKIGQGAKPGIGGHLPGVKVTKPISETRRIPVGRDAISPAPHHDIYSIEDLGQRILALKEATGKPIIVKVGATNYIPYIASGIARMGAAGVLVDGGGAGTGAAPTVVKNNVGIPVELAVASVDSILRQEGLRDKCTVIAAGRVACAEDTLKLIALGADIVSLGTASLLALGCVMVHKCHLGYCPTVLTNKIDETTAKVLSLPHAVNWLVNLVNGWTEEMKMLLASMRIKDVRDLRSRRDLLLHDRFLNEETLEILGVHQSYNTSSSVTPLSQNIEPPTGDLWPENRKLRLWEMSENGEAEISSMGAIGPPFVETPVRICDWLMCDGAQVTRPSIDPYREEIEISTYLAGGKLRLAAPFFFTHLPEDIPVNVRAIFARTALAMGLLYDDGDLQTQFPDDRYMDATICSAFNPQSKVSAISVGPALNEGSFWRETKIMPSPAEKITLVRLPSSLKWVEWLAVNISNLHGFSGFIIDEDMKGSDVQLEIPVSLLDRCLRNADRRVDFSILAEGDAIRGSEDVFKLLALGADAVGLGKAALMAVGWRERRNISDSERRMRLENFAAAVKKEIKLIAGAAGVSSVSSSLVGSRELLRSVNLDPEIRSKLDVKPAGVG